MASDKEKMLSNANYYANVVASAKNACSDTALELLKAQSEVSSYWSGTSGSAMLQALEDVYNETMKIYGRLYTLENQMKTHARSIYNNWPEEAEDIS